MNAHDLVDSTPAYDAVGPGSTLSEDMNFFFFSFFFIFNLTTWMRVFSQINKCQQKNKKQQKTNKQTNKQYSEVGILIKDYYHSFSLFTELL